MRLATIATPRGATFAAVTERGLVDLGRRLGGRFADLKAMIAASALHEAEKLLAQEPDYAQADVVWLPVIPNPGKILCVGLNYREHVAEAGRGGDAQPAFFVRVAESQVGHRQPILRPRESAQLDFEAEVALIIGKAGRRISRKDAWGYIAGYSCYNDASVRDWQRHTAQWTAGKNFAQTGAFGPWMVTADEIPPGTRLTLSCRLNGERMQHATTDQMIFSIPRIIEYCSAWTPLAAGDVIVTGTPGGVGCRRDPPVYLRPGDTVEVEVGGIGVLSNVVAPEDT